MYTLKVAISAAGRLLAVHLFFAGHARSRPARATGSLLCYFLKLHRNTVLRVQAWLDFIFVFCSRRLQKSLEIQNYDSIFNSIRTPSAVQSSNCYTQTVMREAGVDSSYLRYTGKSGLGFLCPTCLAQVIHWWTFPKYDFSSVRKTIKSINSAQMSSDSHYIVTSRHK